MEPLRRTVLPFLRTAVAPISSRISNVLFSTLDSPYGYMMGGGLTRDSHTENLYQTQHVTNSDGAGINNHITVAQHPFEGEDRLATYDDNIQIAQTHDVSVIQDRVSTIFDDLQTEHMGEAELHLLKTIRETAGDTDVMAKIMSNHSFQDFVNKYVPSVLFEQQSLLEGSRGMGAQEDEPDNEEEPALHDARSSAQLSHPSENQAGPSSRRINRSPHEIALNRLHELCSQITPDLGLSSLAQRTGLAPNMPCPGVSENIEARVLKPTMEGAGVPGGSLDNNKKEILLPKWDPVYVFVISACVIPITILAVTAAMYPSPRTFSLLRNGFKAVCGRLFA